MPLALVYAILLFVLAVPTQAGRPITAEDYLRFEFAGSPVLSPDATQVVFTLTRIDERANRRRTTLWLVPFDRTAPPRPLTGDSSSATNPQWSPDGTKLAFLSTRGEAGSRPQIWILPLAGGEAQRLTDLSNGVTAYQWSPGGDRLAVVSKSGPSDKGASPSDVRHYKHIRYKFNDTGWFDDKRSHLWIVDGTSGAARQITDGDEWDDTDPQWSPDGKTIAFVSDRTGLAYESGRNTDVWTIPAEGGPLTRISDHPEADTSPRWSPDGKAIAFLGSINPRQHPKLYLAPAAGGQGSKLAIDGFDYLVTDLKWTGANTILFESGVKGTFQLIRADLASRKAVAVLQGERAVRNVSARAGKLAYLVNDFRNLDDVYIANEDGSNEHRLTNCNEQLWKELDLAGVERLPYKSTDGTPIDGFLVKPAGFQEGRKYPLILSVHGGPAGQYGVDWYHEFQVYAGKGYGVFFTNPRGSTGYGEEFARAIKNNWGKMDYVDIMTGLDEAIRKNKWIDTTRLGVTGGSYGGYMTNWIVSHSNRFQAAVTLRSVSNFISDDGTRDGAYGHEEDFKGFLFDEFNQYWDASPLKYAAQVRTPTLILHSDNDYRVPLEQGEQWFRALKHYKVTTELVIFPRENHNLTRTGEPKHIVESMNWQLYWFEKYLQKNIDAKPPDTIVPSKPSKP
jgi:dipeptidyl aminopeptidase/acylaminoacyl peptidase